MPSIIPWKKQLAHLLLFLSINVVGAKLFNKYKKHIQICMHFDFHFAFLLTWKLNIFFDRMLDWMWPVKHAIGENINYKKHIQIACILILKRGRCMEGLAGTIWGPKEG